MSERTANFAQKAQKRMTDVNETTNKFWSFLCLNWLNG